VGIMGQPSDRERGPLPSSSVSRASRYRPQSAGFRSRLLRTDQVVGRIVCVIGWGVSDNRRRTDDRHARLRHHDSLASDHPCRLSLHMICPAPTVPNAPLSISSEVSIARMREYLDIPRPRRHSKTRRLSKSTTPQPMTGSALAVALTTQCNTAARDGG
jgi:hypothetical protein